MFVNVSRAGANNLDYSADFRIISGTSVGNAICDGAFAKDLGKTSNGHVVWLHGGSIHPNKNTESGVEADDAFGMPAEDYANILASCITLK